MKRGSVSPKLLKVVLGEIVWSIGGYIKKVKKDERMCLPFSIIDRSKTLGTEE